VCKVVDCEMVLEPIFAECRGYEHDARVTPIHFKLALKLLGISIFRSLFQFQKMVPELWLMNLHQDIQTIMDKLPTSFLDIG
jgi:hypothetical protein